MTQDANTGLQAIHALIEKLLSEMEDVFLVSVKIKPVNNIKIYLDADGGLNIDRCVKLNRSMYHTIEEEGWYPDGNFSLEVSSPGIDEPLQLLRQYKKNIGRTVEITLTNEVKLEGKLMTVSDEAVTIEYTEGKNKKAVILTKEIAFDTIKQTVVQIVF